jgi:hypothetical protein
VNALTDNGAVEQKDLYRVYQEGLFGLLSERDPSFCFEDDPE